MGRGGGEAAGGDEEERARQAALARAGREYFDRVVARAAEGGQGGGGAGGSGATAGDGAGSSGRVRLTGGQLLGASAAAAGGAGRGRAGAAGIGGGTGGSSAGGLKPAPSGPVDPDLQVFEALVEDSKEYVLLGAFVMASACQLVTARAATRYLAAPCFVLSCHLVAVAAVAFGLASAGLAPPLSVDLREATRQWPFVLLQALELAALFSGVRHGTVYFVLCWTFAGRAAAAAWVAHLSGERILGAGILQRTLLVAGVAGGVLQLAVAGSPGARAGLYVAVWAAAHFSAAGLRALGGDPARTAALPAPLRSQLGSVFAVQPMPVDLHFLALSSLSATPFVLVLGFLEGDLIHLTNHELSVPAMTAILVSCAVWSAALCTLPLLPAHFGGRGRWFFVVSGLAGLGTVVVEAVVHSQHETVLDLLATALAVLGASGSGFIGQVARGGGGLPR